MLYAVEWGIEKVAWWIEGGSEVVAVIVRRLNCAWCGEMGG